MFRNILKIFGILLILLSAAATSKICFAQTIDISINKTALAKEKNTEKSLDLDARKNILNKIIDTAQSEINGLKEKLNDFDLNEDWQKIRNEFLNNLSDLQSYYQTLEEKISGEITIEDVKIMAKELKNWREKNYTFELKKITNMILIFETENILKIAGGRMDKISADVKKLAKQNIIKTDVLKIYLSQAEKHLENAEGYKKDAKDLYFKTMNNIFGITEQQEATSTEKETIIKKEDVKEIQDSIRNLIKESITELRATYDIFFKMNDKIKKYL
ncbi:hypothetical protein HZB05_00565 [Candidatus Wolfebacteria bacterium]|nr:hypothetical protein [Candidatus Wolfebacteria bacterium]